MTTEMFETIKEINLLREDDEQKKSLIIKLLDETGHTKNKLKEETQKNNNLAYAIKKQEEQINRQAKYIDKYIKDVNIINNLIKNTTEYTERIKNITTTNETERKLKDTNVFQNIYIEDLKNTVDALLKSNKNLIDFDRLQTEENEKLKEEIKQLKNKINKIDTDDDKSDIEL